MDERGLFHNFTLLVPFTLLVAFTHTPGYFHTPGALHTRSWCFSQVELDALSVAGLELLTEPAPILTFDLQVPIPLPLSGSDRARVKMCSPTPLNLYARENRCLCDISDEEVTADCIVSWFEVDLDEGGWLSTGPGKASAMPQGHWAQSIQLMEEPLRLAPHGARDTDGEFKECWIEAEYNFERVLLKGSLII